MLELSQCVRTVVCRPSALEMLCPNVLELFLSRYVRTAVCPSVLELFLSHCVRTAACPNVPQIRLSASDSGPFFQRRPGSFSARLAHIPSGWPGQVLAKRIWSGSKPVCKKHRGLVSGRTQPARYQFFTFSQFRLGLHAYTEGKTSPDCIVQN